MQEAQTESLVRAFILLILISADVRTCPATVSNTAAERPIFSFHCRLPSMSRLALVISSRAAGSPCLARLQLRVRRHKRNSLRAHFSYAVEASRRRAISNNAIAAATETLSELTRPYNGIRTTKSAVLRTIARMPCPSEPNTSARRRATSSS